MSGKELDRQFQTPAKEGLLEKDRTYMWHHMTPFNANPFIAAGGKGSWVTDIDGNRYLDGMSGLWCVNIGYGREELAEAAYEQLKTLCYYPLTQSHTPAIELSEKVSEWLQGEYRVFYSNSGSEANEVAFKIARQYHHHRGQSNRYKVVSRYRAYHGNSMGALAATGQSLRKVNYEPLAPGFLHVSPPYCYRCSFGKSYGSCSLECAEIFDEVINWEGAETVGVVIMEPTITGGGVIVPPPEYLPRVQDICRKHGVLFHIDEVICGFGRSGRKFGHQNFGVKPDIVTMAKGFTSAYLPLSATAVKAEIADTFMEGGANKYFRHINTFGGNPAACALALRNLSLLEEENLIERAAQLGIELRKKLSAIEDHPNVGDIRSFGFMAGIEMVEDCETKEAAAPGKVAAVIAGCRQRGLIIGKNGDTIPGFNNILTLCPPFSTSSEEIDFIVNVIIEVFDTL
jgi:taurine-pyruvate aminotransferase